MVVIACFAAITWVARPSAAGDGRSEGASECRGRQEASSLRGAQLPPGTANGEIRRTNFRKCPSQRRKLSPASATRRKAWLSYGSKASFYAKICPASGVNLALTPVLITLALLFLQTSSVGKARKISVESAWAMYSLWGSAVSKTAAIPCFFVRCLKFEFDCRIMTIV